MSPLPFTFVNVSNAPGLGPKERREMRGHVTQTNFAKRRLRLAKARDDGKSDTVERNLALSRSYNQPGQMSGDKVTVLDPHCDRLLTNAVNSAWSPIAYRMVAMLYTFRPFIFPAGTAGPGSSREAEWIALLQSEPALVEASTSIALSHCTGQKDDVTFRQAVLHKGRAIKRINQKLSSPSGLTDGVLSAVFTLTYAALLESDSKARDAHIQGLAQMIRVRRSVGNTAIPSWFCDFLLYDSLGQALLTSNYSNQPLIQALQNQNDPNAIDIEIISHRINGLCLLIDAYHESPSSGPDSALAIGLEVERLQLEINTLLGSHENYVHSLHDALQLYLLLLWPVKEPDHLHGLAEGLRLALLQPHMRLCASMELVVWQLFVGATAAEPSSEVRSWFITRLREVSCSMTGLGQGVVIGTLTHAFTPDARLLQSDDQNQSGDFIQLLSAINTNEYTQNGRRDRLDRQLITTENAPLTPIYQLNRELACKVQRNMAIIFETVHFTETTNPESKTVRRRKVTQDLYYLVHLRNSPSRDNLLKYYITAASPETLGNVQLDVTDAQEEGFRAMLNADKSAADILLFNRDTQQLLFDIKPKWQGGQYQWIDVNGVKVASEFGTREEPRLHIEIPLQQQKRDALVALWILRLWYSIAENRTATRQGEQIFSNINMVADTIEEPEESIETLCP
ncbi:unnamed protein product [Fusarium graminearum]|nr:unnamed protein product [Fusarium graminearum]